MVPRNLILQRSDDIEVSTKPKRGEGSLHPRPKGQGIRDPPHSRSNNHVHLFLEFHPSTSLSEVVQYLKGGSSYRLFKLHDELRTRYWGGSLWSSGKFYRSVGNVTADTIKHYIK